jgi:integrase
MKWQDVPEFYASLNEDTSTHLALKLLMLTGVRSKSLRFMHEDEISGDIWTIPAELIKGRKGATVEFRVPLSKEALALLAHTNRRDGYLFPSIRKGVISDATMSRLMERRGMTARPHGFRSSFRDWIEEMTNTPYEVAEMALGHKVGGRVERAYRRTDYLDQRRILFQSWAEFLSIYTDDGVGIAQ